MSEQFFTILLFIALFGVTIGFFIVWALADVIEAVLFALDPTNSKRKNSDRWRRRP